LAIRGGQVRGEDVVGVAVGVLVGPAVAHGGARYENLKGVVEDFVNVPTTMPWGNRALLFRDPDGNLVNFFTPVTPEAIEKFNR
jgi:hypothetical protein